MTLHDSPASPAHRAHRGFVDHFQTEPALLVQAPGRVNLIGEHTDYNDGFVLPCALDFQTVVAASARRDGRVQVLALDQGAAVDAFGVNDRVEAQAGWTAYVRGMVAALRDAGHLLGGANLCIAGNVPQGAGLSSSASLEVAVGQAFKQLYALHELQAPELARIAQQAENLYAGCRCGIMDQMVSAAGQAGHALLLDCRSLATRAVPLPPALQILVLHSNVKRGLVDSAYNERRQQCEQAAAFFGVAALRDLTPNQLGPSAPPGLDPVSWRRARHVVSENARTLAAASALEAGDLQGLGRLMAESHASMRHDFEITVPAIDQLVDIVAASLDGEGGVRMTGGGFGGCVVALTTPERAAVALERVRSEYRSPEGLAASVYRCRASAGAGLLPAAVWQRAVSESR